MPRRREPIETSAIAQDIMSVLQTYATDEQFYPTQNALLGQMRKRGYNYSIGCYNYWFSRLVEAKRIAIDRNTRAIRATCLEIVERDGSDFSAS